MVLTESEVVALTKFTHHAAQARQLNVMGIKYIERADGSLAVSKALVIELLGGGALNSKGEDSSPNWSMVNV